MKNIATIIAIVLISSFGFAQSGAKIEFRAADNTIDYGTVSKQNDNGVRSIEFTNTGDAPLIITNVLSTSGFTITSTPNSSIAPGRSGKVEIKYNMVPGPIRKTITIESNAVNTDNGRVPLKIKGMVSE
jgi:hypothetical protein